MITDQVLTGSTNNVPPLVLQPSPASTSFSTISSSKMLEVTKDTKLFDLATTLVNENYSTVILKKLPKKLEDPVVHYVVDPCVPLILGRPFLRTGRALIDVYGEELTLCVDDEAITFKVDQTLKYSYNDAELINQIDVIDVAYEEYVQEVLGFLDTSKSGNPTPTSDLITALSSPSLNPFEEGDFTLEKIKACLTSESIPLGINDTEFDLERDIRLLEELLNKDPSSSPLPSKELNMEEIKIVKSFIDKPPKHELKELPSHLEYAFLEMTDKLPIIISKELKDEEKFALLEILNAQDEEMKGENVKEENLYGMNKDIKTHPDRILCIEKRRMLNPSYIGPFKGLAKVKTVAYRLKLPQQLSMVCSTFPMSNLKKCLSNESLLILLDEIHIDDKMHFIKEPIEIINREVKQLKQSRILNIKPIDNGPYQMGSTRDTLGTADDGGITFRIDRPRTYNDLDEHEKKIFDADIRATNIVLQGLPKDIDKLINHNTEAKAICDNIIPGENITDYYVKFHKLVNDMRNIKMPMPNIQLNSKFVNNMSPEWDRLLQGKDAFDASSREWATLDEEELLFLAGEQANTYDADVDDQPIHDMAQNDPNIF
nr:reverse transcriptase domain-containing protein [Tanacetum cinerariifolium]